MLDKHIPAKKYSCKKNCKIR